VKKRRYLPPLNGPYIARLITPKYFDGLPAVPTSNGLHWLSDIITIGTNATERVAEEIARVHNLKKLRKNLLATISSAIGDRIRAELLLRCLERTNWNLTHTAEILGMGSHPSFVIHEIKKLGLDAEYSEARKRGLVFRSGHRERVYVRNTKNDQLDFELTSPFRSAIGKSKGGRR